MMRMLRWSFLASLMAAAGAMGAPAKPNVLIIVADDLGYADVGFMGSKDIKTPNLDRFAASGVKLNRFYACPVCSPTRAGIMTGRWPLRYGLMKAVIPPWSDFGLPATERTLPELLADVGYERRGMVGKWHLGHHTKAMLPPQRGFSFFYGHYNGAIDYFTHKREEEVDWHKQNETLGEPGYTTDLLANAASDFIKSSPADKPWMLYAAFNAPHEPLEAKPEDLAKYPKLNGKRKTYAAMIDCLDQGIGRVLAAVEARPDADNTLVLFMSDNGGLGRFSDNSPSRGGKFDVYEGGIRVCAAIRWPAAGLNGGGSSNDMLGYIDIAPTVLAAAGGTMPTGAHAFDGIDMAPILEGKQPAPVRPWYSYFAQGGQPPAASIIEGDWKLVRVGGEVLKPNGGSENELFNLASDRTESMDVVGEHADIAKKLAEKLEAFGHVGDGTPSITEYGEGRAGFKAPKDWVVE